MTKKIFDIKKKTRNVIMKQSGVSFKLSIECLMLPICTRIHGDQESSKIKVAKKIAMMRHDRDYLYDIREGFLS